MSDARQSPPEAHRISAIMIARNAERHIAEALSSIVASTRTPDEILVIDGHSTDRTRDIAASVPGVRVELQSGKGIAAAYNEGVAQTSGDLIAFLSSDDRWAPEKLALQEAAFHENPELELLVCHVQHALEPGHNAPSGFRLSLLDAPVAGFIPECLMVRRRVFARIGMFDTTFAVSEDTDWFARARDANVRSRILPQSLVWKRVHNANSSLNESRINHLLLRALRSSLERKRGAAGES